MTPRMSTARTLSTGLGWFSIGLGLCELFASRQLARGLGMCGYERLIQAYGLREMLAGIGLLTSARSSPWLWGRVAGDVLDAATLAPWLGEDNPQRRNVEVALGIVAGAAAIDFMAAQTAVHAEEESRRPRRDYTRRSGFSNEPRAMRGKAADAPADYREPLAMRPKGWDSVVSYRAAAPPS
jgi:hypothetical protein